MPQAFFMTAGGTRLFASLHGAAGTAGAPLGLVVCPGLLDEHIAAYRILYGLAERLAAAGVAVLRFDPPGHGDSEGALEDAAPEGLARAASEAARVLRERAGAGRVGFLGLRLGCAGALAAAAKEAGAFCVAWAPILSAERYLRDLLRRQVLSDVLYGGNRRSVDALVAELAAGAGAAAGEGVDVGGYLLTASFYAASCAFDVPGQLERASFPLLVVQRETPSAGVPQPLLERVAAAVPCHHALDDEAFWAFPREGSVPPRPARWIERTLAWILALRTEGGA